MATAIHYDPNMSVLAARARYFRDNRFGDDGGYADQWVTVTQIGPLPLGFPNTAGRVRAVRRHDLHHLVTGYDTDLVGEAEIAAWELASGCRNFPAAWVLNSLALPIGVVRQPGRMRRAFARGCNSSNLYSEPFDDALLAERLGDLRGRLGVDSADSAGLTGAQRGRYRLAVTIGVLMQLTLLAVLGAMLAAPIVTFWVFV